MKTTTIPAHVMPHLLSIEWEGNVAKLTCGQLNPKDYKAVNSVLETLGGKWTRKLGGHLFGEAAHDELELLLETGEYVDAHDLRQHYGEFETPDDLADEVVAALDAQPGERVLEPSAGSGQLIAALLRRHEQLHHGALVLYLAAVEIQDKHGKALKQICDVVHIDDFLELSTDTLRAPYDKVVMNPPFARQADVDHVMHAWDCLKPGGRLVAITSTGWTFRTNKKSQAFQDFVAKFGRYKENPDGAFKEAGTEIKTLTVVLNKPS